MTDVDALTLRRELTQILDRVGNGEVITVTKRGKVVAILGPPGMAGNPKSFKPQPAVDTRDNRPPTQPKAPVDPDRLRAGGRDDRSAADGIRERPSPWDLKYGSKGKTK